MKNKLQQIHNLNIRLAQEQAYHRQLTKSVKESNARLAQARFELINAVASLKKG